MLLNFSTTTKKIIYKEKYMSCKTKDRKKRNHKVTRVYQVKYTIALFKEV